MPRDLIIDGYNLMHAAGLARRSYGPGGLERSRSRLLARLAELLSGEERQRTTVVFDAKDAPAGRSATDMHNGIYVLFAQETDEADDMIEALIARHSAPKQLLVVSSDHRLHKAARRRKATACDSEQFLDRLEVRASQGSAPASEPDAVDESEVELSSEEVQHWMREFSDVDVDQIQREVNPEPKIAAAKQASAKEKQANESKTKVPEVDAGELAMWEDLLADVVHEEDDSGSG